MAGHCPASPFSYKQDVWRLRCPLLILSCETQKFRESVLSVRGIIWPPHMWLCLGLATNFMSWQSEWCHCSLWYLAPVTLESLVLTAMEEEVMEKNLLSSSIGSGRPLQRYCHCVLNEQGFTPLLTCPSMVQCPHQHWHLLHGYFWVLSCSHLYWLEQADVTHAHVQESSNSGTQVSVLECELSCACAAQCTF